MNIQVAAFRYLKHIFSESAVGVKALLLDSDTLEYISVAMSKTELYTYEVVLIEQLAQRVHKPADPQVASLTCYILVRPTQENIDLICTELSKPSFAKYALFFTNSVNDAMIHQLASHDSRSLIENCQEVYLDFSALGTRLFSLNIQDISNLRKNTSLLDYSERIIEGLYSSICSLSLKPIIRYDKTSELTGIIANGLSQLVADNNSLFSNPRDDNALVLILDRRNDPVTPLLHFLYYLPTLHDLFKIQNNIITIGRSSYIIDERNDPETEKIDTMYLEDAGHAINNRFKMIKQVDEQIKDTSVVSMNEKALKVLQGANDMTYAQTHLELFDQILTKTREESLTDIASFEQIIATVNDAKDQCQQFCEMINSPICTKKNALRLALIYALHYEKSKPEMVGQVISALETQGPWLNQEMKYARTLVNIAGQDKRSGDIFSNRSIMAKFKKGIKNALDNRSQYEYYRPQLEEVLKSVKERKLDLNQYPYAKDSKRGEPQKVIIFYIGGATYMEHVIATQMSGANNSGYQFIVGGTTIHNADTFLQFEVEPFVNQ